MLDRILAFLKEYTARTAGDGPSTTKLVWLHAGLVSVYCAALATVGGVSVYLFQGKADSTYWLGVGALWVNSLGFASSVQRGQHKAAAEIAIARAGSTTPGSTP